MAKKAAKKSGPRSGRPEPKKREGRPSFSLSNLRPPRGSRIKKCASAAYRFEARQNFRRW